MKEGKPIKVVSLMLTYECPNRNGQPSVDVRPHVKTFDEDDGYVINEICFSVSKCPRCGERHEIVM